jgi:DNA polymerase-4
LRNDLSSYDQITPVLDKILDTFWQRLTKANNFGRTLTLKLKTSDFQVLTRSLSKDYYLTQQAEIRTLAHQLLEENIGEFEKIRLIGLSASNLQKQALESGLGTQLEFDFDIDA